MYTFNMLEPLVELGFVFLLITAGGAQHIPFKFRKKITAENTFVIPRLGDSINYARRGQHDSGGLTEGTSDGILVPKLDRLEVDFVSL